MYSSLDRFGSVRDPSHGVHTCERVHPLINLWPLGSLPVSMVLSPAETNLLDVCMCLFLQAIAGTDRRKEWMISIGVICLGKNADSEGSEGGLV